MDIAARLVKVLSAALDREIALEDIRGKNLIETLGLSSIDALEVLIRMEGEFGIHVDDEDLSIDLVSSFSALEQYVTQRLGLTA